MSAVAGFYVVFIKSVGMFFQNGFIVLALKGLHVAGATVADTYGMSVENNVKFVSIYIYMHKSTICLRQTNKKWPLLVWKWELCD